MVLIKALSVKEPWASMIRSGEKTIETRTRKTNYRGPLLIVASKNPPGPFAGKAVAVCRLVGCRPMQDVDETSTCCRRYPGAYSWMLQDVYAIDPFPVRGCLGLYDVEFPEGQK